MARKLIFVASLLIGFLLIFSSCSSSKKMKKKCRDCPEFSLEEKTNTEAAQFDEQV